MEKWRNHGYQYFGVEMLLPQKKAPHKSFLSKRIHDALLSSLLDPLEGLGMLNCEKLELGTTPDFQH